MAFSTEGDSCLHDSIMIIEHFQNENLRFLFFFKKEQNQTLNQVLFACYLLQRERDNGVENPSEVFIKSVVKTDRVKHQ